MKNAKICPVCAKTYTDYPAISRKDNHTEICPDCGMKEALEDAASAMTKSEASSIHGNGKCMNIYATCPSCGSKNWSRSDDGAFECVTCGNVSYPEEMQLTADDTFTAPTGVIVRHKEYGKGTVAKIVGGNIYVTFEKGQRIFPYPEAFIKGYLTLECV